MFMQSYIQSHILYLCMMWELIQDLFSYFLFLFSQIDALGKRSKEAEAAFLNVYKRLIDVPGTLTYCAVLKSKHVYRLKFHWTFSPLPGVWLQD